METILTRRPRAGILPPWVRLVREPAAYYQATDADPGTVAPVRDAASVAAYLRPRLEAEEVEAFVVLVLNGKNCVVACAEVSRGTLTAALVHPREVFRPAIALGGAALILAHNHPSGDPRPSAEDMAITTRLREVGTLIGIAVLDHVVIGAGGRYVSMAEAGPW